MRKDRDRDGVLMRGEERPFTWVARR
jgi:hypothetical protein